MSRNPHDPAVPAALRAHSPGWRDPRLWVGVVLVTGSVVVGSQVLASADDTTPVWATATELVEGQEVEAEDLVQIRVRFADAADAEGYVTVDEEFPDDVTLSRSLGAGELLPESALGAPAEGGVVSLALSLPAEEVPHDLAVGSRVDVWVVGEDERRQASAEVLLEDVAVLAVPAASGSFGATGAQQVVLAVPEAEDEAMATVLAAGDREAVRIVGRGGR